MPDYLAMKWGTLKVAFRQRRCPMRNIGGWPSGVYLLKSAGISHRRKYNLFGNPSTLTTNSFARMTAGINNSCDK